MPNLNSTIESLASQFAQQIIKAIRSSSLEEILGSSSRPSATTRAPKATKASAANAPRRRGRLARRSTGQIAEQLTSVVALLNKSKGGLRSEQIRGTLKLDRREIPRVLAEGLKSKAIRKTGQKRATVYRAN